MTSTFNDEIWEHALQHGTPHEHPELERMARDFAADATDVLDFGCGVGTYVPMLAASGAGVIGADRSPLALEHASAKAPNARFVAVGEDERLPLEDNCVDAVWCAGTLEHVVDTQVVLSELRRVLRPGGKILVITPDHPLAARLRIALTGWEEHFDPTSPHLRFYTRRSLREILQDCGFDEVAITTQGDELVARARRR